MKGSNIKPNQQKTTTGKDVEKYVLMLHNDDINSFDYVIKSLVEVCSHNNEQAEQCAFITHYKGKCDVKNGSKDYLKPMRNILSERGLSVTIE